MKHGYHGPTGDDALAKLLEGNSRYVEQGRINPNQSDERRDSLIGGQSPYAIILGARALPWTAEGLLGKSYSSPLGSSPVRIVSRISS